MLLIHEFSAMGTVTHCSFDSLILGAFGEIAKSYFRLIEVEHWDQLYEDITVHSNNSIRSIQIMVGCISCIAKGGNLIFPPRP